MRHNRSRQSQEESVPLHGLQELYVCRPSLHAIRLQAAIPGAHGHGHQPMYASLEGEREQQMMVSWHGCEGTPYINPHHTGVTRVMAQSV